MKIYNSSPALAEVEVQAVLDQVLDRWVTLLKKDPSVSTDLFRLTDTERTTFHRFHGEGN